MQNKKTKLYLLIGILLVGISIPLLIATTSSGEHELQASLHKERKTSLGSIDVNQNIARFKFDSGYNFEYPDAVRGIYVTGNSAGSERFNSLVDLIDSTDLNTMVIDVKEDNGNITFTPEEGSPFDDIATVFIDDPEKMMKVLEEKQIYPIARVVVFKDSVLAENKPELSFKENGEVWKNGKGEAFVNPFEKEVW
ncbi:MAG TPA: putative glycoside hydrolase, partial [Pseudogracilibacillus sp.]|nr:putative glycoside hydrolase [Pseudogracilibacillus sp.]